MKVLLINHFPLEGSGSGTYTKNIALHLRKRGHEVCVIFPENRPVLMLPGIRMFPVMFSAGKASWSSLPFNFPCFTTHPRAGLPSRISAAANWRSILRSFPLSCGRRCGSFSRTSFMPSTHGVFPGLPLCAISRWLSPSTGQTSWAAENGRSSAALRRGDCGQRKGACHFTGQPGSCHFRAALLREQAVAAAQRL